MSEITIKIEAPDLVAAIVQLAAALCPGSPSDPEPRPEPRPGPAQPPVTAAAPVAPPVLPVAPTAPTPSYTLEQLSRAGADMVAADRGKMPELLALLQQFGVPAVTMLPVEQYGAFATALRGLGAKI